MSDIKFKGKPVKTIGNLPKTGQKCPDFKLVGNDLREVTLKDLGSGLKILNIVPSLDTGTCSTSAKKFNEKLKNKEVVLVNISMDLPFAQDRFCKAAEIQNSKTLSAFRSSFGKDFGVLITDGPLAGLLSRIVLVLDGENTIVYEQQVPEITEEPDYDAALSYIS